MGGHDDDEEEDEEEEDASLKRVAEAQEYIRAGFALRLYEVVDGAMRQRWHEDLQVPIVRDVLSAGPTKEELTKGGVPGAKRRAVEIVHSVIDATSSSASARSWSRRGAIALESIAVCALLSGVDPRNDLSVAVRAYALTGMVEEAWTWLLEGADSYAAMAEAGLLMANGALPSPELEHGS